MGVAIRSDRHRVFVWGHRGAPALAPENTVESFETALAGGVDGVELDVQTSSDGVVVVVHDDTVDRTTDGRGVVGDLPWSTLQHLRTRRPDGSWSSSRIPSLDEVLESLPRDAILCVEYKFGPRPAPRLVQDTLTIISTHDAARRVIVSSFDHMALRASWQCAPDIPRAVAWGPGRLVAPWTVAESCGATFLHLHRAGAMAEDLERVRGRGLGVAVWSLHSAEDVRDAPLAWIDAIFVDDPAWAASVAHVDGTDKSGGSRDATLAGQ